jgi:hypothetical protein
MITSDIINIDNKAYVDSAYHVVMGAHRSIDCVVFADNEQEALDIIIDYYEAKREHYEGFFLNEDDLSVMGDWELYDYISGGNCGTYTSFTTDELHMKECRVDGIEFYVDLESFK